MSDTSLLKTNFSAGEIGPELFGRSDLKLYQNGASKLENVFVLPTGGVTRRHGTRYVDTMPQQSARLVPFEKNDDTFLLVIMNEIIRVYKDDALLTTLTSPWSTADLPQISWVQSNHELLLVHPSVAPQKLTYEDEIWTLVQWQFDMDPSGRIHQPYHNFQKDVTMRTSGTTGEITLYASAPIFTSVYNNSHLRIRGKEIKITSTAAPTQYVGYQATAYVYETLPSTAETLDWQEPVFSGLRGWPKTVAFHQDRLVVGGSYALPNRIFLSKTGNIWNFDLGTGLDDEAIEFSILSDQQNDIQSVFSARHLLVFTSSGEWLASGTPLTPGTLQITRQSRIGTLTGRYVPPQDVDGATYFISRNGDEVREMFYSDIESAYSTTNLAATAAHMVQGAIDMAYDPGNRFLHAILADGTISTLTIFRTEGINAWSRQTTVSGKFVGVRAVGQKIYLLVDRDGVLILERFDMDSLIDCGFLFKRTSAQTSWTLSTALSQRSVKVILDGILRDDITVPSNGVITTSPAALTAQFGLNFISRIEPLPPSQITFAGARAMRLVELRFRLHDTAFLSVDSGHGSRDIPLSGITLPEPYTYLPRITKDVSVRCYGWVSDTTKPLWSIVLTKPQPFNLLSITVIMKVSS